MPSTTQFLSEAMVAITALEASTIVQILGDLPLMHFNTPSKMSVLTRLLDVDRALATAVGHPLGVHIVLTNVPPGNAVAGVRAVQAATGLALDDAIEAYEFVDPDEAGGCIGPFVTSSPSIVEALELFIMRSAELQIGTGIGLELA